ncbi:MAG: hypothetical protein DYH00_08320 [Bacteroidetes bacterium CHB6]|nr:hypothetical protein [Bacteroidetes bacterium CHB6]
MEFKIIIYFLIAIGWYVMNNYKKLAQENRKRTFGKPVDYPPVSEIPKPAPAPVVKTKKVFDKSETTDSKVVKMLERKPEKYRKQRPDLVTPEFQLFDSVFNTKKEEKQSNSEENVKQHKAAVFDDENVLRNAIIYGEIINQPRWSIY